MDFNRSTRISILLIVCVIRFQLTDYDVLAG